MLITPAVLADLRVSFSSIFRTAWETTDEWGSKLATTIQSNTRTNVYGWMARLPAMREWLGPRLVQNLKAHSYTLENKDFELTYAVKRSDIEDDNLGVYTSHFQSLGESAKQLPDDRLAIALQAGTTGLGFDGLAFFATTHDLDPSGNQSNNFTGTALTAANWDAVRSAMVSYTGEDGRPLKVRPNLLVVPPQLEAEAKEIVAAERLAGGATNVHYKDATVLVVDELSNAATTWYAADARKAIRPLIWQNRKVPQLVSLTSPSDPAVFDRAEYQYGVDARGAAGYGPWFLMARAIA